MKSSSEAVLIIFREAIKAARESSLKGPSKSFPRKASKITLLKWDVIGCEEHLPGEEIKWNVLKYLFFSPYKTATAMYFTTKSKQTFSNLTISLNY